MVVMYMFCSFLCMCVCLLGNKSISTVERSILLLFLNPFLLLSGRLSINISCVQDTRISICQNVLFLTYLCSEMIDFNFNLKTLGLVHNTSFNTFSAISFCRFHRLPSLFEFPLDNFLML